MSSSARWLWPVLGISLILSGCVSKPGAGDASRSPASVEMQTRSGETVAVPDLRAPLNIPACPDDVASFKGECLLPDEQALLDEVTRTTVAFQTAQNPPTVKVSQRDFHAKHNACLAGVWTPLKNVPERAKVGVFAMTSPVRTVIRWSNGGPKSPTGNDQLAPDAHPEPRGLAIKLVDVPGDSILNVEDARAGKLNQDFILINFPQFFLRTPKNYPQFMTALTKGQPFFNLLDPLELSVLKASQTTVPDEVAERFFSQVPYVLGDTYAKYSVRLCDPKPVAPLGAEEAKNPHFLRERIRARVAKESICLIFSVQPKGADMPVEDAAVEWKQSDSAFIDVAKIVIPRGQDINDPARDSYCENMSFNPWNSLAENRPAGAINRARLAVYTGISRKRRMENKVPVREARSDDGFFDVLK